MTNALKFTKNGSTFSLDIKNQKDSVLFTFSDNAIGIPEKFHNILFDKYTEARRTGLHGEPTVSLGISVIKTIIEWHKGKIWFESRENEGTVFYIELPKTHS